MRLVMITTSYKGIFVGHITEDAGQEPTDKIVITDVRNVINFRSGQGFLGIAANGPEGCKVGPACGRATVMGPITGVWDLSETAAAEWAQL